jgi:CBS domain-containing protein
MKVAELMVEEVTACSPDDALNRAAQIMWENDCGCVPVVDRAARLIAMLTDRDICMAAYTRGRTLRDIKVSAAMSSELFACKPDDDLLEAQKMMRERQVRRLPVSDDKGRLVGVLSLNDVARAIARKAVTKTAVADTLVKICAPHSHPDAPKPQATARGNGSTSNHEASELT